MSGIQVTNSRASTCDQRTLLGKYANVHLGIRARNLYEPTEYGRASGAGTVLEIN